MTAEATRQEIIQLCHSALDSHTLRFELLERLRTVIPYDYMFFSTTDPTTHLFTSSVLDATPPESLSMFIENEFLQNDFNKFIYMFRNRLAVSRLSEQTQYDLGRSQRYRDILAPMHLGDEMRAVFVTNANGWGTLCLHRERAKAGYTPTEADFLAGLTPHIAEGLRKAMLLKHAPTARMPDGPGVLVLAEDLSVAATTPAADYWMAELAEESGDKHRLPFPILNVVTRLQAIERGLVAAPDFTPKSRLHTRSGYWLTLSASWLRHTGGQEQIIVIFELAQPTEIAPLILRAYDLTKREGEVTHCVLRGHSTSEIAAMLHISSNTVQDHLKAIFEKVGVSSRRELAARIFTQHYQPHFQDGAPLDTLGRLTSSDSISSQSYDETR